MTATGGQVWKLELFSLRLDQWQARDPDVPDELRSLVEAWLVTRYANPYEGMFQEAGHPNLWSGKVPGSEDGCGHAVACSYWIFESTHTVKCNDFAILGEPIV